MDQFATAIHRLMGGCYATDIDGILIHADGSGRPVALIEHKPWTGKVGDFQSKTLRLFAGMLNASLPVLSIAVRTGRRPGDLIERVRITALNYAGLAVLNNRQVVYMGFQPYSSFMERLRSDPLLIYGAGSQAANDEVFDKDESHPRALEETLT